MEVLFVILLIIFGASLLFIFLYSIAQIQLVFRYLKKNKRLTPPMQTPDSKVCIQLPLYNEPYVVERLIEAICKLKYPKHLLEIQVLDDSNDGSEYRNKSIVKAYHEKGFNIHFIHRTNRIGYKAGALKAGLEKTDAEFIAIFDADFVPDPQFLNSTVPHFQDEKVGMIQTCWDHLNAEDSLITQLQAFGLDAHFSIEQVGRNKGGNFINFNGTAGIWRRTCIEDAGNWQADTLTEDLDLSYRAQLKNWQFIYLEEVKSPAELPPIMNALRSQQYRWTKGGAESAKKHLKTVLRSPKSKNDKFQAFFHLLNSSIFICIFLSALISVPILLLKKNFPEYRPFFLTSSVFLFSFISISMLYAVASIQKKKERMSGWLYYFRYFPQFLSFSMGLSYHNSIAVLEGYAGKKTPFIRTPKFNDTKNLKGRKYLGGKLSPYFWGEIFLFIYFSFACIHGIYYTDFSLFFFHLLLCCGFGMVCYYTLKNPQ